MHSSKCQLINKITDISCDERTTGKGQKGTEFQFTANSVRIQTIPIDINEKVGKSHFSQYYSLINTKI